MNDLERQAGMKEGRVYDANRRLAIKTAADEALAMIPNAIEEATADRNYLVTLSEIFELALAEDLADFDEIELEALQTLIVEKLLAQLRAKPKRRRKGKKR